MSATTAGLSREGPLGPRRPGTRAAVPSLATAWSQRRRVSALIPKPSATRTARAPLIATSCTAASRRPSSSPAFHAKTSSPRMNTRPPVSSSTRAEISPICTAPAGTSIKGSCAVMIAIVPHLTICLKHHKNYNAYWAQKQVPFGDKDAGQTATGRNTTPAVSGPPEIVRMPWNFMILVVRRLTVGLRNPINYDAAETKDSRPAATYMQVRRLWPPGWRALCPEPCTPAGGVTFTPERASLQDQSLPGGPRPRATPGLSKKRSTTRRNGLALRARITHAVYRVTGVVRERP